MAPVELVGFARIEGQRHVGLRRHRRVLAAPAAGVTPNGIVAALVAEPSQGLEDAHHGQPFARRLRPVGDQQLIEVDPPLAELG